MVNCFEVSDQEVVVIKKRVFPKGVSSSQTSWVINESSLIVQAAGGRNSHTHTKKENCKRKEKIETKIR